VRSNNLCFIFLRVIWEENVAINRTASISNYTADGSTFNDTLKTSRSLDESSIEDGIRQQLVLFYSVILSATLIVYLMRTFGYFRMCLRISLRLHDRLFRGITRATMYFFNTNSSGRILNRFSKDIRTVDTEIPRIMLDCIAVVQIPELLLYGQITINLVVLSVCH